jgi:oligopeptidase B
MIRQARLILVVLLVVGCRTTPPALVAQPPVAKKIPHVTTIHGDRLVDDYFWLRRKDSPAVLAYLRAEDAYTDRFMAPTKPLQDTLYKEMLGHIQETDQSVPYRNADYLYYQRTIEGKQYPIYCRKHGSTNAVEQITLDLNALAAGQVRRQVAGDEDRPQSTAVQDRPRTRRP